MAPLHHKGVVVVRVRAELRALNSATGDVLWSAQVDPGRAAGHLLHRSGDLVVTDRRPDPARTTELVVVRSGSVVSTIKTGAIIVSGASIIHGETFHAIVNDPSTGVGYRAFDLASGTKVADASLADVGADMLLAVGDRLLVGNRIASPGLYWMRLDGARGDVVEHERAHVMEISGNRLVATLYAEPSETRTVRAYDLPSGRVLWSAPSESAVAGIDGDAVMSFERGGEGVPVLRDTATGAVRWRAAALADKPASVWFAGPYVFIEQGSGMTGYKRDTGALIGDIESCATAQFVNGRLYFGGLGFFTCCASELSGSR
jgi:outer membrane protein assembly factor BamB